MTTQHRANRDRFGMCPICSRETGLTDEHIVGKWLEREMKRRHQTRFSASWRTGTTEYLNLTVPICLACNRRMNRQIEQPAIPLARPMIFDQASFTLNRTEQ